MILTDTGRCILDVINELKFSKAEKFKLLESYVPFFMDQGHLLGLRKITFFVDRIYFVETLKEYAGSRQRGVKIRGFCHHIKIKF